MGLSTKKKALAALMIAEPKLTNVTYAKRIGIDPKTLYKWKKTEEFKEYTEELLKEKWKDSERIAMQTVVSRAKNGDLKAAQYILDSLGYGAPIKHEGAEMNINVTITD